MELEGFIRDVEDFPKPGVTFKDISPLLGDATALGAAVEEMSTPFRGSRVNVVAGIEARGFIFGPLIAQQLDVGFVPIRKSGKLPSDVIGVDYDLEYGSDRLEMHQDAIDETSHVLLVDDVLATGGTLRAALELLRSTDATVEGITVLIDLVALGGSATIGRGGSTVLHSVLEVS